MKFLRTILILLLINTTFHYTFAQSPRSTKWFEEARFGMFIHWGLYSAAEGLWKGENLRYLNNYAEWIQYRNRISKEEYGTLAKRFDWSQIDPEQWVLLAKEAGMKYIIMTSKHHDGVAMWDTKIGDYSLTKLSDSRRDIIKELADACRKHNMKLGFYYSHWIDWEHPYAWNHNLELTKNVTDAQFNQYWQEKAIPQLRELLSNYGDIAIMWFDMWIPYQKTIFKKEQLEQAVALIRELQPNCLINSRLGLPTDAKNVDFETLGDNVFANSYIEHPWETPGTIAHSWGFNSQENEWKSTSQIFESLLSNVSLNGGLTLNIGPRANGKVPYESVSRLQEIGKWLGYYGDGVYGAKGLALRPNQHDWGYLTSKKTDSCTYLYAQVTNWPLDHTLRISGISSKPSKIHYLFGTTLAELEYEQKGPLLHVKLPTASANNYVSSIRLTYDKEPQIDNTIVAESTFGGFSLNSNNILNKEKINISKYDGKNPQHIKLNGEILKWNVYLPNNGKHKITISAHNPSTKDIQIELKIGSQRVIGVLKPNGKIVAEPNEKNYTEEFVDIPLKIIDIKNIETQQIELRTLDNSPLWFNYIWIEKI